jgi:hypothetical protein
MLLEKRDGFAALIAVVVLVLGAGSAAAQGVGVTQAIYDSANPNTCFNVSSTIEPDARRGRLLLFGDTFGVGTDCPDRFANPSITFLPGSLAVRMALLKWNGTSAEVCQSFLQWNFNQTQTWISTLSVNTPACGDGHYNLLTEGCAWAEGAWRCGMVLSGWLFANVDDNPPVVN